MPGVGPGPAGNGSKGDLGGVEKLAGGLLLDGANEHAVAYAGDEIADAFIPAKRRHGPAEGFRSFGLRNVTLLGFGQHCLVDLFPCTEAQSNGAVVESGVVDAFEAQVVRRLGGFEQEGPPGRRGLAFIVRLCAEGG